MKCWCGNANLLPWGDGYQQCAECQTLVADNPSAHGDPRVTDESTNLYGRDYWFKHQTTDLNCPDIVTRSRSDLAERAIHWLRSLLQFKLPPATVLEIGCAHGGFVAMLNQAGYQARGLELSPWVVRFASQTFGVEVLTGPIEDQTLVDGSLDVILMMDVMEHLPDPVRTFQQCSRLLKPDGLLLVQTPEYPQGKSLEDLHGHQFPRMLDPGEHLFLFSQESAAKILRQVGLSHIQFVPAIFGFYDMCFVAGMRPIQTHAVADREAALMRTVPGRMLQALLDADARRLDLLEKHRALLCANPANGD